MKLSHTCYYFEHYPHYLDTINSECKFNIHKMDEIRDRYEAALANDDADAEEEAFRALNALLKGYAGYDIMDNWPEIRKDLERKGEWGAMWEEGSHAISMTRASDACKIVAKIEAQVLVDTF